MSVEVVVEVVQGTSDQMEYRYDQSETIIIGRQPDCKITLQEMTVSRYHCLLELAPPHMLLQDFGSKNGTYRIREGESVVPSLFSKLRECEVVSLASGDTVCVGKDCALRFRLEEDTTRHRCDICNQTFVSDNPQAHICATCIGNRPAVMETLLDELEPIHRLGEGPSIPGYETIRMLGAGATGEAWLLSDLKDGKPVVCKQLSRIAMLSGKKRDRFLREAGVVSQLSHPNVIRQFGSGESGRVPYLLTEYCPGGSIADFVQRKRLLQGRRLELPMATHILMQLLDALTYVHTARVTSELSDGAVRTVQGVVHRDISPKNIFLMDETDRPVIKLADFGFAKAFETAGLTRYTTNGEKRGTWDFIPRIQINDFRYSKPDVDVWAAAATYYSMLTGYPPKNTVGVKNAVHVALHSAAVPIRNRNHDLPPRLAEVIDFALQENEDQLNVRSALELKRMIEGAL